MGTSSRSRCDGRKGFTLIEILIAIGIMGVGLVMVAALFPAAMRENVDSVNDTLGMLICENGLRIARLRVTDAAIQNRGVGMQLDDITPLIGSADRKYGNAQREFHMLARHANSVNINDYQVVTIGCGKLKDTHTVHLEALTGNIEDDGESSKLTVSGGGEKLALNSPVITSDGLYSRIVTSTDNVAFLEQRLPPRAGEKVWIVYEKDASGVILDVSPAMAVLVSRNAFR